MTDQLQLPDIQPEPSTADDAERAAYRERLREHLRDPDFRTIEGFPIGDDEAILALSDPPYYTACPNPFLPEIIERWQAERAQIREELGLPDDSADNSNGGPAVYHREPFASDVSEGKNNPIYNAHSYHTKVPHKAVMRYILHYTDPGDIVFDGFCGTGMAGVAAQLCGDRKAVRELGYRVDEDGVVYDGNEPISHLGARRAVLVDLCPAATFIAYNYDTPVDVVAFERGAKRILREVEEECGWMYETLHTGWPSNERDPSKWENSSDPLGLSMGKIEYVVWSDIFLCPHCGVELVLWDVAVDAPAGKFHDEIHCPQCGVQVKERELERAWEMVFDIALGRIVRRARQKPVLINYSVGKKRFEKKPDDSDLKLVRTIEGYRSQSWFPTNELPNGDNTNQPKGSHGAEHVHQYFTARNNLALSAFWKLASDKSLVLEIRERLMFCATASMLKLSRRIIFSPARLGGGTVATVALYFPSLSWEKNVIEFLRRKVKAIAKAASVSSFSITARPIIATQSSQSFAVAPSSVDYVFVDPPFGGNLMYSELNYVWEAWLRVLTNNTPEAIVNKTQKKILADYQRLMESCFQEFYRILKPGRWMTVEFHNSSNRVWNAIQEAILRVGFMIADVRVLDKKQSSFKQETSVSIAKKDLIISAYKPRTGFERRFLEQAGSEDGAWAFVRQHLEKLPIAVEQDGLLEVVAGRQPYLLFDRMVAFHIQRGATVPLSAAEFYAGLRERFVERDGMYFLPDQVPEYDRARLQAAEVAQLTLFVSDEKSSIQWLRQQLDSSTGGYPQTYQEIQPQFLRQLHQARHEVLPELSEILEQNFLQDEVGHWYVPDPNRAGDLEKLRQRALLREFAEYTEGRGRLRKFRTEAVRAGFADAWRRRDYAVIVKVAERLPERVLQEDPDLLMYYDNATLRMD
ncbi:MAG: DNA methylase [Anaerolineales bacterium]|nr:MAG: DNA methylase [Anaerolineales bacterium]